MPAMSYIYCLYSTEDGEPRYIGKTADKVSYRFRQHITAALEKEPGALYDWIQEVWRRGHDVMFHTLQEEIIPKDEDMFEQYWVAQFAKLLNVIGNSRPTDDTQLGKQVTAALKASLEIARSPRTQPI
jgi:hypothetical protein